MVGSISINYCSLFLNPSSLNLIEVVTEVEIVQVSLKSEISFLNETLSPKRHHIPRGINAEIY
jgi:hypothetical protein